MDRDCDAVLSSTASDKSFYFLCERASRYALCKRIMSRQLLLPRSFISTNALCSHERLIKKNYTRRNNEVSTTHGVARAFCRRREHSPASSTGIARRRHVRSTVNHRRTKARNRLRTILSVLQLGRSATYAASLIRKVGPNFPRR